MKICSKCKVIGEFSKNRTQKDGLNTWCKVCQRDYSKQYHTTHKKESKQYYANHKEKKKRNY